MGMHKIYSPEEAKERNRQSNRRSQLKRRMRCLDAYGRKCACCGETNIKFLSIDHVEGGGNRHRREIGSSMVYPYLIKNNFPPGFQVLCHNCNLAKGFYGNCPHQEVQHV